MSLYNTKQVTNIIGVSSRQLLYWVESGLVKPALSTRSKRSTRLYDFTNLVECRAIQSMLEQGMSVAKILKALNYLRKHYPELKNHLSEFKLITNGRDVFIIDKSGLGIKPPAGQIVLLVPFGDYHKEVKQTLKKKAIKPSITEIDALAKLTDTEFWEHPLVLEYTIRTIEAAKNEPTFSHEEMVRILDEALKHEGTINATKVQASRRKVG